MRQDGMATSCLRSFLDAVGLSGCDLSKLRKNDARNQVVAWLLWKRTTVRNRWPSERLVMGHERVLQSVRAVAQAQDGKLVCLRQALEEMLKNHGLTPRTSAGTGPVALDHSEGPQQSVFLRMTFTNSSASSVPTRIIFRPSVSFTQSKPQMLYVQPRPGM